MAASDALPAGTDAADLVGALSAWYEQSRRDLPWRRTRDPYAIWISEAMLQQTRVETVIPYWERFLSELPSVEALAAAPEEQVLALWSGLGYYRRARGLHAAAQRIVADHGGRFPLEPEAARALPGVGPYTAGAVLSIAYDRPEPVVDGNVKRVFARLFALEGEPGAGRFERELWDLARALVPAGGGAGRWNQALMELGATVCLPRDPACCACPVAGRCAARAQGRTGELPRTRPRPEPVDVELEIALARTRGRVLLQRRPPGGRMAGLWQLPTREVSRSAGAAGGLFPTGLPLSADGRPVLALGRPLGQIRHGITRHRIRAVVLAATAPARGGAPDLRWHRTSGLADVPITGMTRKVLAARFAAPDDG